MENYLNFNSHHLTDDRIAGVIFSAPFFGINDSFEVDFAKKMSIKGLASVADEFIICDGKPLHLVCRNKQYLRQCVTATKYPPLASLSIIASFVRCIDRLNPAKFNFSYLMVLAEKEYIVNNRASRAWRDKTKTKIKALKLMPGSYHELTKEPNNHILFEAALNFMGERLYGSSNSPNSDKAKPFGEFKPSLVKYW